MRFVSKLLIVGTTAAAMAIPMAGTAFASTGTSPGSFTHTQGGNGDKGGQGQQGGDKGGKGGGNTQGGNGGSNKGRGGEDGCSTGGRGGLLTESYQSLKPADCYPKPDPKPYYPPKCSTGRDSHSIGADAIMLRRTVKDECQPQGGGWNYQSSQNNWYDPTQDDWYYPVTGWTGGYQDSKGCWHYPTQHGYQDNSYVYPGGNYGGSSDRHRNSCKPETITFEFATYGTWLLDVPGSPLLHNGEVLTYEGQTGTVEDWAPLGSPNAHGSQGDGNYFTLTVNGHELTSTGTSSNHAVITDGWAHTICPVTTKGYGRGSKGGRGQHGGVRVAL